MSVSATVPVSALRGLILAVLILVLTSILAWMPWGSTDDAQARLGERGFFGPPVTDVSEALALARSVHGLRIYHYDHEMALLHHFEVVQQDGQWVIPSHHAYPADGADRVGRTAGSVLGIERLPQSQVTTDPRDHTRLGVLSPDDENAPFGMPRGKRVVLTGSEGQTLLDLIIGSPVEGRPGWRYIRQHSDDTVYQVEIEPILSTRFTDYVNQDLLQIARNDILALTIDPHRVDRQAGNVITPPTLRLHRRSSDSSWQSADVPEGQRVDGDAMRSLLDGVTRVRLQGVRPLQPLSMERMMRFGFFTNDGATIWGNEGALQVQQRNGLKYTLYFGNRAPDEGLALTAGDSEEAEEVSGNNRYMIILVSWEEEADRQLAEELAELDFEARRGLDPEEDLDAEAAAALQAARQEARAQRRQKMEAQRDEEQRNFLSFFYVISGTVFDALRPDPESLFSPLPDSDEDEPGSDPSQILRPSFEE